MRQTAKYALDRIAAACLLFVLAPLLIAIAGAVRLGSPGPVLFRQRRVSKDGELFDLLKFRSMRVDDTPAVLDRCHDIAPGGVEGCDRRTTVGRFLRSSSLDELPQLFNVLRGEMSLIGPRPERPEFVEQFQRTIDGYDNRHRVKAGITGLAQVHGFRGKTSIAGRIEKDNHYIDNWSFALDFKILCLTPLAALRSAE